MPLVPRRPFNFLDRLFEDWLWERSDLFRELEMPFVRTPKTDIYEEDGNIAVKVELPGVSPKNIDIEIKDNTLVVEAKSEEKKEEKKKGYYRKEISAGYYKRSIPLPVEVKADKAEAEYTDGILKVVIPKAKPQKEEKKGIKVKIKS
jgi:HSP20 family protein